MRDFLQNNKKNAIRDSYYYHNAVKLRFPITAWDDEMVPCQKHKCAIFIEFSFLHNRAEMRTFSMTSNEASVVVYFFFTVSDCIEVLVVVHSKALVHAFLCFVCLSKLSSFEATWKR